MTFNEYQDFARSTAIYPTHDGLSYCALGLTGEAGEVANKVKKKVRDGVLVESEVAKEVSDCLWYIANLSYELGYSLEEVVQMNVDKLSSRKERGTIGGEGDNR